MNNTISQSHTASRMPITDVAHWEPTEEFQASEQSEAATSHQNSVAFADLPIELMPNILRYIVDNMAMRHMDIPKIMKVNKQFLSSMYDLLKEGDNRAIKAQTNISSERIYQTLIKTKDNDKLVNEKIPALFERKVEKYGLKEIKHVGFSFSPFNSNVTVNTQVISAVLRAIANKENLKNLDVYIDEFHLNILIDDIIHILNNSQNLYSVYLHFNNNELTAADMEKLGPALNKAIAKFYLINNRIESDGIKNLAPHFQNTSIFLLKLDYANIGNEGLRFLEENLPEGRLPETLEFLLLEGNNIDHEGMPYFNRILPNNIKNINLSKNKINNKAVPHIVDLLKNKGVGNLYLCANNITLKRGGAEVLIAELHDTNIRRLDLRNNSSTIKENNNIKNKNNQYITIIVGMEKYTPTILGFETVYD